MNLLLFEPGEADGARAVLRDRRARHLLDVLGVVPGQHLRAGVIGGPLVDVEVVEVADDAVTVALGARTPAPPHAAIDLAVAVPRPKVIPRLLQHATACAVHRIDLINAWRVDKSYLGSSRLDDDAIALALRLGAEQGVTTHLPALAVHPRFVGWLAQVAPPAGAVRLVADARGVDLERALPPGDPRPVAIAIGPEGGWIERELDSFAAHGFTAVRLGAPVLRVEAAVTAALAQIALLRRL